VQTVQVFAQEAREAAAFRRLSNKGYDMAQKYALFQVKHVALRFWECATCFTANH
jgi:hypothetical protein